MSVTTSVDFKIRGLALMPANSTVPVVVVPGIMGTNLKAKSKPRSDKFLSAYAFPMKEVLTPTIFIAT
ncbi:hypothetical protein MasN3_10910 [Massilia varians]|uniref:Uncharacterized protein n=1 Tax=Massilia varians TaxID=457921 RepID=A0ABN6T5S6_9BURK|nr:hypothetical protein MasN3_10910 [Massilia varians]